LLFARTLAREVPRMLGLTTSWEAQIGTSNPEHYETVMAAREHLREASSLAPAELEQRGIADIDALERVTKRDKGYVRAWSTLAIAYLHMKGEDSASLDTLALNAADKAIALDPKAAEAQAVRGYVQYRRGQWLGAHEQLLLALQLQPTSPLALTGLACLLVDAGLSTEALPVAERAAKAAPMHGDARECLVYARAAAGVVLVQANEPPLPTNAARVVATVQMLEGDHAAARTTYEEAITREQRTAPWLRALVEAAGDRTRTVPALREITSAASQGLVDPSTEMLAGLALKRSDFVFNRLLRLQKSGEYAPLRVLWLPQATSLRKNPRFAAVLDTSNLATFWARHGKPDVCANEPRIVACR
jgi:tetratricopeptide (TPR) repeat protein